MINFFVCGRFIILTEGFWRERARMQADPNVPGLYFSTIRIATNVEEELET